MLNYESFFTKRQELSPFAPRIPKFQEGFTRMYVLKKEENNLSYISKGKQRTLRQVENDLSVKITPPKRYRVKTPLLPKNIEEIEKVSPPKPPEEPKPQVYSQRGRSVRSARKRRATLQEKDENSMNLGNLSSIINGMKDMLGNMPNVGALLNKSVENSSKKIKAVKRTRNSTAQLNDTTEYNSKAFKTSGKLSSSFISSKLSQSIMQNIKSRISTQKSKRKKSPSSRSTSKSKNSVNIDALQSYFLDFHAKSKLLLGNLERSVLGENNICK